MTEASSDVDQDHLLKEIEDYGAGRTAAIVACMGKIEKFAQREGWRDYEILNTQYVSIDGEYGAATSTVMFSGRIPFQVGDDGKRKGKPSQLAGLTDNTIRA